VHADAVTRRGGAIAVAIALCAGCRGSSAGTADAGCPTPSDLAAAAPACNVLANSATAIPFTPGAGTAPVPTGGALLDGLYEATRTEMYGGTTGFGRRITLDVMGGGTRISWVGEVLDATGKTIMTSFRADTALAVQGTKLVFTTSCVSTSPSPIPAALDFTATPQTLAMSLTTASGTALTTYTRRGCAP
jgi:hypothetical protein